MTKYYWALFIYTAFNAGCINDTESEMARAQRKAPKIETFNQNSIYTAHDFDTVALTPITLTAYDIAISYPVYWQHTSTANLWMCRKPCPTEMDTTDFCPNFVINQIPRNPTIALTEYGDTLLARLFRRPEVEKFQLIRKTKETIHGLTVLTVDYKALMYKRHIGGTSILIEMPTGIVTIAFLAPNYPPKSFVRYRGLYERIIQSIEPL